jgi:hypothetical protein
MKFPDWLYTMDATLYTEPDGSLALRYEIRPRRWHPGYWLARWAARRG